MGLHLYYVESVAPYLGEILQTLVFPHFNFKLRDSFRILCPDTQTVQDLETAILEYPASGEILIGRSLTSVDHFLRDLIEVHPSPRPVAGLPALSKALRLALKQNGTYLGLDLSTQGQYLWELRRLRYLQKIRSFSSLTSPPLPQWVGDWEKILSQKWGLWTEEQLRSESCRLLQGGRAEGLGGLREIFFLGFPQVEGTLVELIQCFHRGFPKLTLHLFIPPPEEGSDAQGLLTPLYQSLEKISESIQKYRKIPLPTIHSHSFSTPLHEAHALAEVLTGSPDETLGFHGHGLSAHYLSEVLLEGGEPDLAHRPSVFNPSLIPEKILRETGADQDGEEEIYFKTLYGEILPRFAQWRLDLARANQGMALRHLQQSFEILREKARWETYQEELRPRQEWIGELTEAFRQVVSGELAASHPNLRSYGQPGLKQTNHAHLFEFNEGVFPKKNTYPLIPALAADPLAEFEAHLKVKAILHLAKAKATFSFFEQDMNGQVQRPSPLWELFIEGSGPKRSPLPPLHSTGRHPYFSENCSRETHRLHHPEGALDRGDFRSLPLRPFLQESFQTHPLSATYLDDFAKCPWKFFARRHLKLDETEEWVLEIEPKMKGRLAHALLEKIYLHLIENAFSQGKIPDGKQRREAVELGLSSCMEDWRETAEFQQLPPRLRQEEMDRLRQRVSRFLELEAGLWEKAGVPLYPAKLEWRFGKSPHPPVSFTMKDGSKIPLSGSIDRIDYNAQTGEYLLMDYKNSRSSELAAQLREGLSYQLFLYLFAAARNLYPNGKPLGALYGDLKEVKKNQGMARKEGLKAFGLAKGTNKSFLGEEQFSQLQQRLCGEFDQLLQNILAGAFSLSPVECQGEHCPYHEICRYDRQPR